MGLFKSRQERKIERDIEIKKGISRVKRQIADLSKHEKDWLQKAQRARQMGAKGDLDFIKRNLKNTISQRRMLERTMLQMESAFQLKGQMETYQAFAQSMGAVSKSIAEVFQNTDMVNTQKQFEQAMANAQSMEQAMDVFLSMANGSLTEVTSDSEAISDEEIDGMLDERIGQSEGEGVDPEIEKGLKQIEEELRGNQ